MKTDEHKRTQTDAILLRLKPREKQFIEAASERKSAELGAQVRGAFIGASTLIRGGAIELAEKVMGMTFEEFDKRSAKKAG